MSEAVLVAVADGIATVSLNRPEVMNALDDSSMFALRAITERLQHDTSVRVVVLRGEGAAFCAGGDVALFHKDIDALPDTVVRIGREMHCAFLALRRSPKPVIAVVHGVVAGAGFSLLCAADLAIAAADTRFTLAYAGIGASPDGGSSHFLPRLAGYKRAMQLALLPDMFDAATAMAYGVVNWISPAADLAADAQRLVRRLANGPTRAYAEAKQLMNDSLGTSIETQMEHELAAFARCARTADLREGVAAFVEKRKPVFRGQ